MTQSQQLRKLAARSATAFLLAALCVFPLYIDKFSNLGVVKFTGICTLSWAFALWLGALACVGARPDPGRLPWKADPALWALGAVTASGVVSTVLSLSPGASFWGLGGYYGGCMMVLFTAAGYLAVRAFAPQKILNGLTFCVGVTTALVTVLYVLNIFNIDLIGTYADTAVVERAQFFSTLGQKNFCSGFMAFALPLVFYAFLVARGPRHTIFYGIPAFFGGLALAVVDAEGLMLGVGVAALVLICQKNFTTRTLRRLAVIGAFFFFHAGWMQYMRTHVYTQGGKPMLAALGHVAQRGFVVCLVVWAALYFGLLAVDIFVVPRAGEGVLLNLLSLVSVGVRMMLPCIITGAYAFSTTTIGELTAALRRMHVPESVIIPCAVVVRFFPTVGEDYRQIRAAMALRGIAEGRGALLLHPMQSLEYILMPLLMNSNNVAQDLSAAALTKGIGLPGRHTCMTELRLTVWDFLYPVLCTLPLVWKAVTLL